MVDKARLYVEQDQLRQVGEGDTTVDSTFTVPGKGNEQTPLTILRAVAFVMSSKGGRAAGGKSLLSMAKQGIPLEGDVAGALYTRCRIDPFQRAAD